MPEVVRAAGAVLWRESAAGPEVALVHRPRYGDWSLPKGKLEPDEPEPVAAAREVLEETGFHGPLGRGLGTSRYDVVVSGRRVPKEVRWWSMEAAGGDFTANDEVDDLRWVPGPDAVQRLDPAEAAPLTRFLAGPARTTTVLLVRHGSAGRREGFDGADDDRPLDERGLRQAEALARVLPLWDPSEVLSAPPLRCRQTVAPLAAVVGPVRVEDRLGERAADLDGALAVVASLSRAPGAAVAASQGGLLPQVVERLARVLTGSAALVGPVRTGKGSTWALSFGPDGALVDADHHAALA